MVIAKECDKIVIKIWTKKERDVVKHEVYFNERYEEILVKRWSEYEQPKSSMTMNISLRSKRWAISIWESMCLLYALVLMYVSVCVWELNDIENDDSQVCVLNTGITLFIIASLIADAVAADIVVVVGNCESNTS